MTDFLHRLAQRSLPGATPRLPPTVGWDVETPADPGLEPVSVTVERGRPTDIGVVGQPTRAPANGDSNAVQQTEVHSDAAMAARSQPIARTRALTTSEARLEAAPIAAPTIAARSTPPPLPSAAGSDSTALHGAAGTPTVTAAAPVTPVDPVTPIDPVIPVAPIIPAAAGLARPPVTAIPTARPPAPEAGAPPGIPTASSATAAPAPSRAPSGPAAPSEARVPRDTTPPTPPSASRSANAQPHRPPPDTTPPRQPPAPAPPVVHVTIGRVTVRAAPPTPPAPRAVERAAPATSLDAFLDRRGR